VVSEAGAKGTRAKVLSSIPSSREGAPNARRNLLLHWVHSSSYPEPERYLTACKH